MSLPIFLVEDDLRIRDQLILLAQVALNAEVIGLAETEDEAWQWLVLHQGLWKVAVIDLFLKEGTGFGILSLIPPNRPGKVVVLTNSATLENRARCLALGADAVFEKSAELEKFIDYCARS